MSVYCVNYDLRAPGRNYSQLYSALQEVGVRALESMWFIDSDLEPTALVNALRNIVDSGDGIFVTKIHGGVNWAGYRLLPGAADWLKARRP